MNIDLYLLQPDALSLTVLSEAVGISKGRLSQLRHSLDCPPDLALRLEQETKGKICASEVSPTIRSARDGQAA